MQPGGCGPRGSPTTGAGAAARAVSLCPELVEGRFDKLSAHHRGGHRERSDGISACLRAGIGAIPVGAPAAVVTLVDLPDVGESVVRRVLEKGAGPATLTRATYHGRPGHPVVLGRAHWPGILAAAHGDVGARAYLNEQAPTLVECADLASGRDIDWPDEAISGGGLACVR